SVWPRVRKYSTNPGPSVGSPTDLSVVSSARMGSGVSACSVARGPSITTPIRRDKSNWRVMADLSGGDSMDRHAERLPLSHSRRLSLGPKSYESHKSYPSHRSYRPQSRPTALPLADVVRAHL